MIIGAAIGFVVPSLLLLILMITLNHVDKGYQYQIVAKTVFAVVVFAVLGGLIGHFFS